MLGHPRDSLEVLIYQLVHLTQGGEATKMSKRRGDVVFLDDFIDEIGVDAARWYLRLPRARPERSRSTSTSLPRRRPRTPSTTCSTPTPASPGSCATPTGRSLVAEPTAALEPEERDLVKRLAEFPEVVREATDRRAPHAIPTYAIRVADDFHRFYHHQRVLETEQESFRLALCTATHDVVATCLDLIGIEAPERM